MRPRPPQRPRAHAAALPAVKTRFHEFFAEVKACWDFVLEHDREQRDVLHTAIRNLFKRQGAT